MFDKFKQSKLFFWSLEALVLVTLVFVLSKVNFLFAPIGTFFYFICTSIDCWLCVSAKSNRPIFDENDKNKTTVCCHIGSIVISSSNHLDFRQRYS